MRLFFRLLSVGYVSAIFLLADSSIAQELASFNPYSLLHIPLYGIMSLLFFLAVAPLKVTWIREGRVSIQTWPINVRFYYLLAGLMALGVGIVDEYRQSFMPHRSASVGDALLDLAGIFLFLFLFSRLVRLGRQHA
jgi:VanZ family protein